MRDETAPRPARAEDAGAIETLSRQAYAVMAARLGRPPGPLDADYRRVLAEHPAWVIEAGGRIEAVIVIHEAADHLLIWNVAVDPPLHGRGLGSRLIGFVEAEARRRNLPEVRLYTNALMPENIHFYGRLGYRETRREPHKGGMLVHMSKTLM